MAGNFSPAGDDGEMTEPPKVRQLRLLVNALTVTLIIGFIIIVVALLVRLTQTPSSIALPESVTLPEGERAQAVTLGSDWVALVTVDPAGKERIRVMDRVSGAPRGAMEIVPGE